MNVKNISLFLLGLFTATALLWFMPQPAEAQRTGPWQLVAHSNQTANAGVFRIDTLTGSTSFCYVVAGGQNAVQCTPEVK